MSHSIVWSLVLALHILCIVVWIGGAVYATAILRPSLSLLDNTQRNSVHLQTLGRFFKMLTHVIPTALITGWLLILHEGGFAHVPWTTNAMQGLGVIMALLFVRIVSGPYQKARRAIRPQPATFDSIRSQILIIVAMGVLAVLVAAMGHPFV
ncbi:membrane protein [Acetobacter cibinongensis]|uniref:Membrane protein n=1 Tax=Acetobacter cibinongensis TaxID=146475 RepID=A0A1Z5YSS7_9PROT|nr:membrane protein [Acetobacter cibinongensis]OUJ01260.1 membrane protein [Acetobacter cibinongensis]GAN60770.1 hypothetical protein Abci_016_116 [Acetobacter cibinongensis]GBQ12115.1 hypothetical protein AA0482_0154 [Acetobacter cibinongensis NRIC 0482]GEL58801.1 hypothetical protein ACI01nite_14030 [Acetobacter cibinongensis]